MYYYSHRMVFSPLLNDYLLLLLHYSSCLIFWPVILEKKCCYGRTLQKPGYENQKKAPPTPLHLAKTTNKQTTTKTTAKTALEKSSNLQDIIKLQNSTLTYLMFQII